MNELVSKASVHAFYADAIPRGRNTAENLQATTSERFNTLLESIGDGTPTTALDLGYGTGTYTIALARAGFRVVAVDQIPTDVLLRRTDGAGEWARRIDPRECLAENFAIDEDFGVIVAKDVLHYLARRDVESLLTSAVTHARGANYHYLEVFTGITRRSVDGRLLRIEGEADYSPGSFRHIVEQIYDGWDLTLLWSEHAEQDSRTGRNCFEATTATVIAANNRAA
ncbi:class I SAM-dependent methyltransferase [Streptomyces physcomitrii]|uniref:Methyltransferase domain-containing protein n=1 Tax=Streptomyces physcomitrii TaxID=2724184 RepID=A0ABX1H2X2_9ACTN|nr:class I SAM-dependent methyltransferase [Streptomyces physcomitrii]NKI41614.1 methyltransferase domain-containing protein [Streptomyces physcomitrii]